MEEYVRVGDQFPKELNRLSAGLLIDTQRQISYLFNDRFGMERIFFFEDNEKIVFSSEAKAILAAIPETREFDPIGVSEFFACGSTLGEHSLFNNIRILAPGTMIKDFTRKSSVFKICGCNGFGKSGFPTAARVFFGSILR